MKWFMEVLMVQFNVQESIEEERTFYVMEYPSPSFQFILTPGTSHIVSAFFIHDLFRQDVYGCGLSQPGVINLWKSGVCGGNILQSPG